MIAGGIFWSFKYARNARSVTVLLLVWWKIHYVREASLPALRSALLWESYDEMGQAGSAAAETGRSPMSSYIPCKLQRGEGTVTACNHSCLDNPLKLWLQPRKDYKGSYSPEAVLGRCELTLQLSCTLPWPANASSARTQARSAVTYLELLSVWLGFRCCGPGHCGEGRHVRRSRMSHDDGENAVRVQPMVVVLLSKTRERHNVPLA